MCGIVGYIGSRQAAPILLDGLSKLEYRGYDSAGIAVRRADGEFDVVKAKGKLKELVEKTNSGFSVQGNCGIGHTRWATHGEPSEANAHPHMSNDKSIVGVHNGIIENYQEIKAKLEKADYSFYSDTDTEILLNLIEYYRKEYHQDPVEAITHVMMRVRGTYAIAVMFKDCPGKIFVARKDAPMIIGIGDKEMFLASDVPAILRYTRQVYYIGNQEVGVLTDDSVTFYNIDQEEISEEPVWVEMDASAAEKSGYPHFMLKEIHEQPKAVEDTIHSALTEEGDIDLSSTGLTDEDLKKLRQIYIIGCGSAYHVGVAIQYVIEDLARIQVRVELASEFRYRNPIIEENSLAIIISQSGETADSLAALRLAKEKGMKTFAIVNVIGSSIAREADHVFHTLAGLEIAVATTKAYSTQLVAGYLFAVQLAFVRGTIDAEKKAELVKEICALPEKIERTLEDKERIQWFAAKYSNAKDIFFIGRGMDYAVSLEGSLKLKEISYVHSEAYAAGELKHGTIALIEDRTLVVGILTQPDLFEKTLSNMEEVKTRGGFLMGLTTYGNYNIEDTADFTVYIPRTDPHFVTSLAIVPLQLFAYYVSVSKGLDPDKPKNLAKSVTVE